jgi:hypothetical protein
MLTQARKVETTIDIKEVTYNIQYLIKAEHSKKYLILNNDRSSSRKKRQKSSIVKEVEEATDNKAVFYRAKFTPSDFILILMFIAFR